MQLVQQALLERQVQPGPLVLPEQTVLVQLVPLESQEPLAQLEWPGPCPAALGYRLPVEFAEVNRHNRQLSECLPE